MALYTSIAKGDLSLWTSSEFYLQEKFCRSDATAPHFCEIAEILHESLSAIRSRLSRARKKFQHLYINHDQFHEQQSPCPGSREKNVVATRDGTGALSEEKHLTGASFLQQVFLCNALLPDADRVDAALL